VKYTNSLNLPQAIVNAITEHDYDRGESDITVTELLGPPQIRRLRIEHDDEITVDVADQGFILLGSSVHKILEHAETSAETEKRLYVTVNGVKRVGEDIRIQGRESPAVEPASLHPQPQLEKRIAHRGGGALPRLAEI
jgi:hypothetical protein